ncbi:MAG: PaaI family thioesterase [Pseudomonadota bacterium]
MTIMGLLPVDQAALDRINAWCGQAPMANWLGFEAAIEQDNLLYRLAFSEQHVGNVITRSLHGGVISSFLEVCAHMEGLALLHEVEHINVISVHCNYLRAAKDLDMQARVKIVHRGRRVAFLEAEGWQTGPEKLVARAAVALRLS